MKQFGVEEHQRHISDFEMGKWYSLNKLTKYILRGQSILLWRRIIKKMENQRYQDISLFFVAVYCASWAAVSVFGFEFTYGLLLYFCFSITISDNNWFAPFFRYIIMFFFFLPSPPPSNVEIANVEFSISLLYICCNMVYVNSEATKFRLPVIPFRLMHRDRLRLYPLAASQKKKKRRICFSCLFTNSD